MTKLIMDVPRIPHSGGSVDVINADTWKITKRYKVGKLARSDSVDPDTGRRIAATACGVFELKTPRKRPRK